MKTFKEFAKVVIAENPVIAGMAAGIGSITNGSKGQGESSSAGSCVDGFFNSPANSKKPGYVRRSAHGNGVENGKKSQ